MGANAIEIIRGNSKIIPCKVTGLADLGGYTATLTAAINKGGAAVIEKVGGISGMVITFALTPALTNVAYKVYHYDIVITDEVNEYTLVQDVLEIVKSVTNK